MGGKRPLSLSAHGQFLEREGRESIIITISFSKKNLGREKEDGGEDGGGGLLWAAVKAEEEEEEE